MRDPNCCNVGWTGYGGNLFCYGSLCCAPDYVREYSQHRTGGVTNVIVVNQNTPLNN